MSEATDWIGALGGIVGAVSIIWGWVTSGKAAAAKKAADKAKQDAGTAISKATDAIAKADQALSKAAIGTLEVQLRTNLSSRRDKILDAARDMENIRAGRDAKDLSPTEVEHLKAARLRYMSANEDFLNAFEQSCRHYRDGKVDAESFRLMHDREIREVIECSEQSPWYKSIHPQGTTRYKAIWAVYDDWFNLEKKAK